MNAIRRHKIVTGLVLVHMAALVAAVVLVRWPKQMYYSTLCLGALDAGYMLLPIWAVLGTNRCRNRVAGFVLGLVVLCAIPLGIQMRVSELTGIPFGSWIAVWMLKLVAVKVLSSLLPLAVLWIRGARLVHFSRALPVHGWGWPRFSTKQLFGLTASVGAAITLVPKARGWEYSYWAFNSVEAALLIWVAVWATLSAAPVKLRVAMTNLLAVALAVFNWRALTVLAPNWPLVVWTASPEPLADRVAPGRAPAGIGRWPADWVWAAGLADELKA